MQPIATLPGVLDPAACDRLVALSDAAPSRDGGLAGGVTDHGYRRADLVWLDDLPDAGWAMDILIRAVAQANRESFGFDLSDFAESAQIARYDAARQGHFTWHSDIGKTGLAARRKLTVVVQLSDPASYVGCNLQFHGHEQQIEQAAREQGSVTIFPSFRSHAVSKLIWGTRWSLVGWIEGPPFR